MKADKKNRYIGWVTLAAGALISYMVWRFNHLDNDFNTYITGNLLWLWFVPTLIILFLFNEDKGAFGMRMPENPKVVWSVCAALAVLTVLGSYLPSRLIPQLQEYYPIFKHFREAENLFFSANPFDMDLGRMVYAEVLYAMYIFAWEFFFRGFLTLGMARSFGLWGIMIQAVPFVLLHLGKPTVEVVLSGVGGLALGLAAYYCKSFLPGFVLHVCLFISVDVWVSVVKSVGLSV
ncbi:MAG: CPBP family intramembrane metalloprotease [Abditibacteriota bacterium]|nr:CPBP family intramembrane metalloprotease [Abditibacteriota bacterium]